MGKEQRKRFWNRFSSNPARVIVCSFALIIFIGAMLLQLPIANRSDQPLRFLEALFTATSATTGTGLVVRDTGTSFTLFGQILIAIMMQLGGVGVVVFVTFFNLLIRKRISLKGLYVAQESVSSDSMQDIGHLITMVLRITFLMEGIGTLLMSLEFCPRYGLYGVFISFFLSVSAYCTAGFDVLGIEEQFASLTHYYNNPLVMCTIIALMICGALGFIVWQDLYGYRKRKTLALHTKIVLYGTLALELGGTILFALFEWNNPQTIGGMTVGQKLLNSLFMAVSAQTTTGFNTAAVVPLAGLTKLVAILLMFVGAAPGSTGAGIKVTTAYTLFATVRSALRGEEETIAGKRRLDKSVVYKALAVTSVTMLTVFVSAMSIYLTSPGQGVFFSEIQILFESVSAIGTGLTNGVILDTSAVSRIAVILTMFIGRVGPMSMALSMSMRPPKKNTIIPEAKIMVG